jgi:hypothetical protein
MNLEFNRVQKLTFVCCSPLLAPPLVSARDLQWSSMPDVCMGSHQATVVHEDVVVVAVVNLYGREQIRSLAACTVGCQ